MGNLGRVVELHDLQPADPEQSATHQADPHFLQGENWCAEWGILLQMRRASTHMHFFLPLFIQGRYPESEEHPDNIQLIIHTWKLEPQSYLPATEQSI